MDIDNVSGVPQYIEILDRQQKALKAAMARQGQRPTDLKSRQELITQFMVSILAQSMMQLGPQMTSHFHTSFVPIPYKPCVTPLDELKPTRIRNLGLETHHRGSYLLVRALTPPRRMTAIMAIVEDENGDAIPLQLYQQPDEKFRPATSVIMKNDVYLVKEPYFKATSDGSYGLRVDHVSDIIRLDEHHDLLPEKWKPTVLDIAALKCHPTAETAKIISLNRALAYLKDGSFDAALADTECMISPTDASEKALYRGGQALYGLGRFSECHDIFEHFCKKFPNSSVATAELKRVRCRLAEQQSGIYDFESIYKEISTTKPPHLDHATFLGPVVVKPSPDRGLGLFTTKAVKAGELLLCEKAFAHCYAGTSEGSETFSKTTLLMNVHTNKMTVGTQADLITTIVQKLWKNPSLIPEFNALHRGSYKLAEKTEVDGKPVIDTFLIEQIIALNVFGCPLSSYEDHSTASKENDKHHSCGIWLIASKINHSCLSNARRSFMGDLQLVRATRDIPANTEITFWYTMPTGDSEEMKKELKTWGFQCKCPICVDSETTPINHARMRKRLLRDLKLLLNASASEVDTAKAERLLNSLEKTYTHPVTSIPRLALREPYFTLGGIYSKQGKTEKAVSATLKALISIGFVIKNAHLPALPGETFEVGKWGLPMPGVVEAWGFLYSAYAVLAPRCLGMVREAARLAYRVWVGEDMSFGRVYGV
ncbi:hypothetical protein SS1G_04807 [Sclerotinia sclerotiorum 1980 UF-70]|uniref:SET domain-containing protein n=1 Tax=Sclerotinia sclerotiorum (strain ATCC 18683 / 1980 / Ss-1) TaxID=665079 RepID=A7EHL5_SCLS1|nr:hypothetical protein SS1G_04807 [Sclerotinia sclerotiorum 1980 UF-70]EDO02331.1 hypothetical protein SS1G_04807 [Sclerotinia sclerotiorum 1980 UF-70]